MSARMAPGGHPAADGVAALNRVAARMLAELPEERVTTPRTELLVSAAGYCPVAPPSTMQLHTDIHSPGLVMSITTITSRELNQDVARAKRAARSGPVLITERGKPAHVLLRIEEYRRLAGDGRNLLDAMSMPGLADIDLDPPRARIESAEADLS